MPAPDEKENTAGLDHAAAEVSSRRRFNRAWQVAPAVIVIACYAPVLFFQYGFSEDYRLLAAYDRGALFQPLMIAEGRPLFALWARLVFGSIHGIGALAIVRLLNIVLLAALALMLATAWRRVGMAPWASALAGALTVTLPPFQLYAATAAMGGAVAGALAGASAAFLVVRADEARLPATRRRLRIAAFFLFLAGLATYQSSGLFYWVIGAILLLGTDLPWPVFRRRSATFIAIGAIALLIEFGVYLLGRSIFPEQLLDAPRADLTFNPTGKAIWFLLFPMPHALNLWQLRPNLWFALIAMVALLAGMVFLFLRQEGGWARILLAGAVLPLCFLPNLFVVENRSSFRSLVALAAVVFSLYLIVVRGQLGATRRRLFHALLIGMAMAGPLWASYNVITYVALPQRTELELVREVIAALPPDANRIGITPSDYHDTLAPSVLYDEFGYPSTALPWSVFELTYLVVREQRPRLDTARIRISDATLTGSVDIDVSIDWGSVLNSAKKNTTGR